MPFFFAKAFSRNDSLIAAVAQHQHKTYKLRNKRYFYLTDINNSETSFKKTFRNLKMYLLLCKYNQCRYNNLNKTKIAKNSDFW